MSTKDETVENILIVIIAIGFLFLFSIPFWYAGSYEKTIYVVSVEKAVPTYLWKHTVIKYTDIQPSAVTELRTHRAVFYGISHDIEPGKMYVIKYRHIAYNLYPILDEIIEIPRLDEVLEIPQEATVSEAVAITQYNTFEGGTYTQYTFINKGNIPATEVKILLTYPTGTEIQRISPSMKYTESEGLHTKTVKIEIQRLAINTPLVICVTASYAPIAPPEIQCNERNIGG